MTEKIKIADLQKIVDHGTKLGFTPRALTELLRLARAARAVGGFDGSETIDLAGDAWLELSNALEAFEFEP